MKYLISACLLGENCKYNKGNNANQELIDFLQDKDYLSVCPEQLGGLPTPRASCEIVKDRVIDTLGNDKTKEFVEGAQQALHLAQTHQVDLVITQSRSPSCGKGKRYSGNFDGTLINGNGIFVDALLDNGFQVIDIEEFIKLVSDTKEVVG